MRRRLLGLLRISRRRRHGRLRRNRVIGLLRINRGLRGRHGGLGRNRIIGLLGSDRLLRNRVLRGSCRSLRLFHRLLGLFYRSLWLLGSVGIRPQGGAAMLANRISTGCFFTTLRTEDN